MFSCVVFVLKLCDSMLSVILLKCVSSDVLVFFSVVDRCVLMVCLIRYLGVFLGIRLENSGGLFIV